MVVVVVANVPENAGYLVLQLYLQTGRTGSSALHGCLGGGGAARTHTRTHAMPAATTGISASVKADQWKEILTAHPDKLFAD